MSIIEKAVGKMLEKRDKPSASQSQPETHESDAPDTVSRAQQLLPEEQTSSEFELPETVLEGYQKSESVSPSAPDIERLQPPFSDHSKIALNIREIELEGILSPDQERSRAAETTPMRMKRHPMVMDRV